MHALADLLVTDIKRSVAVWACDDHRCFAFKLSSRLPIPSTNILPHAACTAVYGLFRSLSSICHERVFVVEPVPCYAQFPSETEDRMRELRREESGARRVSLLVNQEQWYTVTVEVRGPQGTWEDISLVADRDLALHTASLCYRLRLIEQEVRAIAWNPE
jgi:hypothetical protein